MGKPVQPGSCESFGTEDLGPLFKGQVCCQEEAVSLFDPYVRWLRESLKKSWFLYDIRKQDKVGGVMFDP